MQAVRTALGPLQAKFNPAQRKSQSFSWIRVLCHLLLLAIVIALFVVFLVYGLVRRDVTTRQEEPRKAGFSISDDGDLHICQCDVSSYSLTTLMGTIEVNLSVVEEFDVCEVPAVDCLNNLYDCILGVTSDGCDVPPGATCDDYDICSRRMDACTEDCNESLKDCLTATLTYVTLDEAEAQGALPALIEEQLESLGYSSEFFDDIPPCELVCFDELMFGFTFCNDYQQTSEEECVDRYLGVLDNNPAFEGFINTTSSDSPTEIATEFCSKLGPFNLCLLSVAYREYGQCTRHACESARYCTALERAALIGELVTKMNTMLGSALISVPQYYGSKKDTIKSIELFIDQTLDFWAEFVLQQGQESLDATTTLCVDGRGLCNAAQNIYSPLHAVRKKDVRRVLREILLTEIERNKDDIYDNYVDLCGDVTCVVFEEKSAFSVFVSSLGAAGGNMGTVFLVLALLYAPIYTFTSARSKSATSEDSPSE